MKTHSTPSPLPHLSDEALDDFLIGIASVESELHLATCQDCRDRVQAFRSDLQTFNRSTLLLSESKPLLDLRPLAARRFSNSRLSSPRWAMAMVVLLLLGAALLRYQRQPEPGNNPSSLPSTVDYETQIAQDNQMLQSVEMALNDNESPAIAEYHLVDSPHRHPTARSGLKHP